MIIIYLKNYKKTTFAFIVYYKQSVSVGIKKMFYYKIQKNMISNHKIETENFIKRKTKTKMQNINYKTTMNFYRNKIL